MPKIIFKCNYIKANKSGVVARKNLVKYIATRDGVVVSSKSQINFIKELRWYNRVDSKKEKKLGGEIYTQAKI